MKHILTTDEIVLVLREWFKRTAPIVRLEETERQNLSDSVERLCDLVTKWDGLSDGLQFLFEIACKSLEPEEALQIVIEREPGGIGFLIRDALYNMVEFDFDDDLSRDTGQITDDLLTIALDNLS